MKEKIVYIVLSVGLIVAILVLNHYYENDFIFGVDIITYEEAEELKDNKMYIDGYVDLYFEEMKIPYYLDQDHYLLTQGNLRKYTGRMTCENYGIVFIESEFTKEYLMENNIPLKGIVYNDESYKEIYITLTNMPVMELSTLGTEPYSSFSKLVYANMRLIEPLANGSEHTYREYNLYSKYRVRGATAKFLDKKPYRMHLISGENKVDEPLLGMRKDNDWILNALFIDDSRSREVISYNIWNELTANKNINIKYIELIVDNRYLGIYGLQVPYDHKQFGLKKSNDILISIWEYPSLFVGKRRILDAVDVKETNGIIDEYEIEQIEDTDMNESLTILKDLAYDVGYDDEKEYFENHIKKMNILYDYNSYARFNVFINMVLGRDNVFKNQKIIVDKKSGNYYISKSIWDLDYTMGENFHSNKPADLTEIIQDKMVPFEMKNDELYYNLQKTIYSNSRKNFYNLDYLTKIINNNSEYLKNGGAIMRESTLWGNDNYDEEFIYLKHFFEERIRILDEYYNYYE